MLTMSPELRCLFIVEAERACAAVAARTAAVSRWDRKDGVLRTLVNVGDLEGTPYERFPTDETYPLDTFPAVAALLLRGEAYLNPVDVSSESLALYSRHGFHAAVPILVENEIWGELWAARPVGAGRFTDVDVDRLDRVAARIGDGLAAQRPEPDQPSR
jgi:GAF domain-containing protein